MSKVTVRIHLDGSGEPTGIEAVDGLVEGSLPTWAEDHEIVIGQKSNESGKLMELINDLSTEEGDSVTICHPNPDFGGPDRVIYYMVRFGEPVHISGESLLDCLQKAVELRNQGIKS